jgi:hypothetical protein
VADDLDFTEFGAPELIVVVALAIGVVVVGTIALLALHSWRQRAQERDRR